MKRNLVSVVGLGPGDAQFLTAQARHALQEADVLCGYTVYIDLVRPLYPEKETYATGMTREIDRCRWALQTAQTGKTVALVCSGDAGVYGMASPLLELAAEYPDVEVEVVPGLTAALSGAAVLGAPLAHDFCVISLSDRLTPWEMIEKRLACAAMGDFCVALYNPSSKGRPDYLQKAVRILLQNGKGAGTLCGVIRSIGRTGQQSSQMTLAELEHTTVDMFTTAALPKGGISPAPLPRWALPLPSAWQPTWGPRNRARPPALPYIPVACCPAPWRSFCRAQPFVWMPPTLTRWKPPKTSAPPPTQPG